MTKKLFLEPHYGDIAWSCSGLVYLNREDSIVLNLFPPRRKFDFVRIRLRLRFHQRKQVERSFERMFNIKIIYRNYKSAFLRGRKNFTDFFDKDLTDFEEKLVSEIREDINNLILTENISEIYCPYAQRNQIDHLIVRKAVMGLTTTDAKIFYYEDFPIFHPESKEIIDSNMKPFRIDISSCIDEKIKAILNYEHLVEAFFKSSDTLIDLIRKNPFETYWEET